MAQVEAQRHVVLGLVGGIAKHHALVAGTLVFTLLALHTTVDVAALLMNGTEHAAGVALKHVLALGVSDAVDHLAGNALKVNVGLSLDFAGQYHLTRGYESLARHLRFGIESKQFVQYGIADLVCHLVGMAFGN